jgi:hypothetical protein
MRVRKILLAAGLLALAAALPGDACDQHPPNTHFPVTKGASSWIGPWASGAWFDPARSGEGFIVQMLPNGSALVVWFTYPAVGEPGDQAWLIAQDAQINGNRMTFANVLRPRGGRFGAGFDPAAIVLEPWGTLELTFAGCNSATATYAGPASHGSGMRTLSRLTVLDELDCTGARDLTDTGSRALSGTRMRSGAWFVPSRAGEGWLVEELGDGRAVVYWFTYTPDGRQAWTIGTGTRVGNRIVIEENLATRGARFGDAFRASDVELVPWGRLEFAFPDCSATVVDYQSTLDGYGKGSRSAIRLSSLASGVCIDGTPVPKLRGSWQLSARMPLPAQSELATAMLDGKIYAMGGFGDTRGFKRYDPETNTWTELPDMPAGRDHLSGFAIDGGIWYTGGAPNGSGTQDIAGYRYDVSASRWDPIPTLQPMFGSHAAILNGRAYIGDADGAVEEFDPRTRTRRRIEAPSLQPRDHSQVVAFLGEIWMLAGRSPETSQVAIYDPVSERWRQGPPLITPRGGFAAAVVADQIAIAGGEALIDGGILVRSTEIFTAGGRAWQPGPPLQVHVHGVAATAIGPRWYVVCGSTVAATAFGPVDRIQSIEFVP